MTIYFQVVIHSERLRKINEYVKNPQSKIFEKKKKYVLFE